MSPRRQEIGLRAEVTPTAALPTPGLQHFPVLSEDNVPCAMLILGAPFPFRMSVWGGPDYSLFPALSLSLVSLFRGRQSRLQEAEECSIRHPNTKKFIRQTIWSVLGLSIK